MSKLRHTLQLLHAGALSTHITASELPFEQRLALLIQREMDWRDSKRLERLLKAARLKVSSACLEDIDWRASRGLSREVITSLAGGDWLRHGHNVLLTGATGCGKTWLACALGQRACREGYSVRYLRVPRLFEMMKAARGDGSGPQLVERLGKVQLLILDDFALYPMDAEQRRDLMEVVEERAQRRSTLVTSQVKVKTWHDAFGDPTLADAVLDRLVRNAYRLELDGGESKRGDLCPPELVE